MKKARVKIIEKLSGEALTEYRHEEGGRWTEWLVYGGDETKVNTLPVETVAVQLQRLKECGEYTIDRYMA